MNSRITAIWTRCVTSRCWVARKVMGRRVCFFVSTVGERGHARFLLRCQPKTARSLLPRHLRKASQRPMTTSWRGCRKFWVRSNICARSALPRGRRNGARRWAIFLAADTANEPQRKQRMTAAFNRGYRTFAAVHTSCTPAALSAEEKYRNEGATLAQEITSRFGN